jgi:hypothetical protein
LQAGPLRFHRRSEETRSRIRVNQVNPLRQSQRIEGQSVRAQI